jgi:hypothetical protein
MLFFLWKGPCPDGPFSPLYLKHGLFFRMNSLILYISLLSIYLAPFLIVRLRYIFSDWKVLSGSVLVAMIYWLFPIRPSPCAVEAGIMTVGIFDRFLHLVTDHEFFRDFIFFVSFALGIPVVWRFIADVYYRFRTKSFDINLFLDLSMLCFLLVMPFSYLHWEKYLLPVCPLAAIGLILFNKKR